MKGTELDPIQMSLFYKIKKWREREREKIKWSGGPTQFVRQRVAIAKLRRD